MVNLHDVVTSGGGGLGLAHAAVKIGPTLMLEPDTLTTSLAAVLSIVTGSVNLVTSLIRIGEPYKQGKHACVSHSSLYKQA